MEWCGVEWGGVDGMEWSGWSDQTDLTTRAHPAVLINKQSAEITMAANFQSASTAPDSSSSLILSVITLAKSLIHNNVGEL